MSLKVLLNFSIKIGTGANVDQFVAGFPLDPTAMCDKVHQAQKGKGDDKRQDCGNVGVHRFPLYVDSTGLLIY
jgi:hypothetical protein